MEWYLKAIRDNYVNFAGRATRQEYWMFVLINTIIAVILAFVGMVLFRSSANYLGALYSLAVLLPSLGVAVRRLHDTNRSGWWLLIALIPIVGGIVLLVFLCLDGTRGINQFGQDPKANIGYQI